MYVKKFEKFCNCDESVIVKYFVIVMRDGAQIVYCDKLGMMKEKIFRKSMGAENPENYDTTIAL